MYLYQEMINPDLYDQAFVARFMDTLLEPEIDSASDANLNILKREIMATDDIEMLAEPLIEEAQERIVSTGTLPPQFIAFPARDYKVRFELEQDIPTKPKNVRRFLCAGKALGLIRSAHCTFFATMQPLKNDLPVVGEDVTDQCPWGILIIGSSLRGNCFVTLQRITRNAQKMCFTPIHQKILREGAYHPYPFSRFFYIRDSEEMGEIVAQIPKLMLRANMSEPECLVNFATTLKALQHFGYHR